MYTTCGSCGATIQSDMELCPYCGKPAAPAPKPAAEKTDWDYCGILPVKTRKKLIFPSKVEYECSFKARCMGKLGSFAIAETEKYTLKIPVNAEPPDPMGITEADHHLAVENLNGLIQKLQKDGWEIIPQTGLKAWDVKFRKKMAAEERAG